VSELNIPKRVLVLLGSPRKKGNSTTIADHIVKGAEEGGAVCEKIFLNDLNIKSCQACDLCQTEDEFSCSIDDDMQTLYPKIFEADAYIIATPIYWYNMSSQTKLFMDRFLQMINMEKVDNGLEPSPFKGKGVVVAIAYADEDPFVSGCVNSLRTFQDAFGYAGPEIIEFVYGQADKPGEILNLPAVLKKAVTAGKKLVA